MPDLKKEVVEDFVEVQWWNSRDEYRLTSGKGKVQLLATASGSDCMANFGLHPFYPLLTNRVQDKCLKPISSGLRIHPKRAQI